ncbi:hypothetical protein CISIN_1g039456mg, partial [Citrus sinensis]
KKKKKISGEKLKIKKEEEEEEEERMRENSLRIIPSPDQETMDRICGTELIRTDSESSAVTVESSHLNGNATPGQSAEWTNEKHNSYLDCLEASFVEQLHKLHDSASMCLAGCHSAKTPSSGQLMVLRDGCWQKIKSKGNKCLYDNAALNSHAVLENPRIRRFTSVGKHQTATSLHPQKLGLPYDEGFYFREDKDFSCGPAGTSQRHLDCLHNSVGSTGEGSDQNFVGEDQVDSSSFRPMAKRLKTAAADARDDQVICRAFFLSVGF